MLYFDQRYGVEGAKCIDLARIASIKVFRNSESKDSDVASKSGLQFIPKDGEGQVQEMVFFDISVEAPHQMHANQDLAKKWLKTTDTLLKKVTAKK